MPEKLKRIILPQWIPGYHAVNDALEQWCKAIEWACNPDGVGGLRVTHDQAGPRFKFAGAQAIVDGYCVGGSSASSGSTPGGGTFVFTDLPPAGGPAVPVTMTGEPFVSRGGAVTGPFYGTFGWDARNSIWALLVAKCP